MADTAARAAISVVVPHLNTPELLARCLASVAGQRVDAPFEIIVVDNGSTIPPDAVVEAAGAHLLHEPQPGPGLARNRGAAAARTPVLAFIDADCRAAPGWLQAALDAVMADPAHTVVGGDIRIDVIDPVNMTGMEAFESVFGFRQRLYIEQRGFSVTANLAMGAAVFAAVGPFGGIDVAEDLDWGRRAAALGYVTRFVPAMRVYHPARPDFASMAAKWRRLIDHERRAHAAAGASTWRWRLRAAGLVVSLPVEAARLLASPKLSGVANRVRGVGALARIRAFRAAEMLRTGSVGAGGWNRQP